MKNITIRLIIIGVLAFQPASVFANHTDAHTIEQLQSQLASLQTAVSYLLAAQGGIPGKPATTGKPTPTPTSIPAVPAQPAIPAQPSQSTAVPAQPAKPAVPASTAGRTEKIQNIQR